jgi:hypothetical protein
VPDGAALPARPIARRRRRVGAAGLWTLGVGLVLLAAVNFLPPDTSLLLVKQAGVLRVCVPPVYPPLVTGDPANPGFDLSVLSEMAKRSGLKLQVNVVPTMGQDFNPRNWRINRAACEVVAGGVTTSDVTRSFLETIATGVENGWAVIGKPGAGLTAGQPVGVFPGSGLDRATLSAYLRGVGVQIVLASSPADLANGLKTGAYAVGIAGALDARQVTGTVPGLAISSLPGNLGIYDFGFGLWKGDLTLKRELLDDYTALDREGFVAQQRQHYGLPAAAAPAA